MIKILFEEHVKNMLERFGIVNKLLLLYLINRGEGRLREETRLQKLVFLSERHMLGKRMRGFTYVFIKLLYGPYSRELARDLENLDTLNYVDYSPGRGYFVTLRGKKISEKFSHVIMQNKNFFEIIDDVIDKFSLKELKELLEYVYNLPRGIRKDVRKICFLPIGTIILARPIGKNYIDFVLSDEDYLRLSIYFDPDVLWIKTVRVLETEVLLVKYKGDRFISAFAPSRFGCVSQGETEEEAIRNIKEAILLYDEQK